MWRVDPDGEGLGCDGDPGNPVAPGEVVADGFSGINDVTVDRRGNLYVTELHRDGLVAFETGAPLEGQGRLTKVTDGEKTEIAAGHLTVPGSAAVTRRGEIFVVDSWLFAPNLLRIG